MWGQSAEEAGSDAPTDQPGREGEAMGSARAGGPGDNLHRGQSTDPSLTLPTPSPPHELKPRMSPFLQVTWVCRSSRMQWCWGWGLPADSMSSSVDIRGHEGVHTKG